MLRRSVYLLIRIVSQGVVLTVGLVSRGAGWTVGFVTVGADRTIDLVSWSVDRTTGLAYLAGGTAVRLWNAAGVERVAVAAAELPESTWGSLRSYVERLGTTARRRARYRQVSRELSSRYRELRRKR